jgi:hypothetical protein
MLRGTLFVCLLFALISFNLKITWPDSASETATSETAFKIVSIDDM